MPKSFTIIGSTEGRPIAKKIALWVAGVATIGEIDANGFSEAFDKLLPQLGADKISLLTVLDHGHPDGLRLGVDILNTDTFDAYVSLRRLADKFAPRSAVVFDNCKAGLHREPMLMLAKLWNTRVTACTGYVMSPGLYLTGDTVMAAPDGSFTRLGTNIPVSLVGT